MSVRIRFEVWVQMEYVPRSMEREILSMSSRKSSLTLCKSSLPISSGSL